jgi:hypothetical protein
MRLCKRFFSGFKILAIQEENWLEQEMQLEILQMRSGDARDSSVEIDQCNQEENGQVTWDDTGKRFFSFRHYYNHEENW